MYKTTILKATPTLLLAFSVVLGMADQSSAQYHDKTLHFRNFSSVFGDGAANLSHKYCESEDECDIQIRLRDGQRYVIVNGDTVETTTLLEDDRVLGLGDYKPMLEQFQRHFMIDDPTRHGYAFFGKNDLNDLIDLPGLPLSSEFDFTLSTDETLMKMERRAHELAEQARLAEGPDKAELEADLQDKLSEIFDYKLDRRRRSIEATSEKLARMKERLAEREAARDDIIGRRKGQLLGEQNELEW